MAALVCLVAAGCAHLAVRLHAARVEIADLRTDIAYLKKRLKQGS